MLNNNTTAHLKLLTVKNGMFRVIAGFTHEKLTQRNADWISSDFRITDDVAAIIEQAKVNLKTDNVVLVNGWYTKNMLKWPWLKNMRDNWK